MEKKISKILLASLLVFGLSTVSYASKSSDDNFNQHETVERAAKKIAELCAYGQNNKRKGQQDNGRSAEKNQHKDKEAVVKKGQHKDKDQQNDWFGKDELTVCKTGKSCQDHITDNGGGAGWDGPTTPDNNPVPEPATMLLLGAGIAGIASVRLRKKNK